MEMCHKIMHPPPQNIIKYAELFKFILAILKSFKITVFTSKSVK